MTLDDVLNVFFKPGGEEYDVVTEVANLLEVSEHQIFKNVLGEEGRIRIQKIYGN